MLVPPPDDEHDCGWKAYAKAQAEKLAELTDKLGAVTAKLEELENRSKGHRSERRKSKKMPPPIAPKSDREETAKKRHAAEGLRRTKLETEIVPVPVPAEACKCPRCGGDNELKSAGGKPSTVYEYIPGYFRRRIFKRETRSCSCGYIITAPAPTRVGEKTRYAPSFIAHLIVTKCSSSMPQYRLEKEYKAIGIPISRSTMCSLFHRGARELKPLYAAARALVANRQHHGAGSGGDRHRHGATRSPGSWSHPAGGREADRQAHGATRSPGSWSHFVTLAG